MTANGFSVAALAYLGDCVLELMVRRHLVTSGIADAGTLNTRALAFVRASAQSEAVRRIEPLLSDEELSWFKRGRNHSGAVPKSANVRDYRRATGMEVLFASLYVEERTERLNKLFEIAYQLNETGKQK